MYTIDNQLREQVQQLLGWSEEQYGQFVYDCGLAYMQYIAGEYPAVYSQIIRSEKFWNWWKRHWEQREKEYLERIDGDMPAYIQPEEIYKEMHDPRTLASAMYLNGQVLQDSYAGLMQEITDGQVRHQFAEC